MSRIFLSYRREDTAGHAGRIFDRLSSHFGRDSVFMDVAAIGTGVDFVEAIDEAVGKSDVFIILIGKRWLTASDPEGKRRLEDPADFVRLELATALQRGVRVIPVLVDGAVMPLAGELPDEVAGLHRRNALELRDTRWDADLGQLLADLEQLGIAPASMELPWYRSRRLLAGLAALLLLSAGVLGWRVLGPAGSDRLERERPRPAKTIPTLGIVPFTSQVEDLPDSKGEDIAHTIYKLLDQSKHLVPVSPASLATLRTEEGDEARFRNAASKRGMDYLLLGRIYPELEGFTISYRLVDTRTGEELTTQFEQVASLEALLRVATPIANRIRLELRVPTEEQVDIFQADFSYKHPDAYNRYVTGLKYLVQYRYTEAEEAFSEALRLESTFGMAHYRLGQIQLTRGNEQAGRRHLEQAAEGQLSNRERAYVEIAQALWDGKSEEAEKGASLLVKDYPSDAEALALVAEAIQARGHFGDEIPHLLTLTRVQDYNLVGWSMLAVAYLEVGELQDAENAAKRILDASPENANAHVILGRIHLARAELESAANNLREALRIDPQARRAVRELARVTYLLGDFEKAGRILERHIADSQTEPVERVEAAIDFVEMSRAGGRFSPAAKLLDELEPEFRKIDAYWADGLALRGLCLMETGDLAAAERLILQAVDNIPTNALPTRYIFARGLVELAKGQTQAARQTAEHILAGALPPGDPDRTEDKAAAYLTGMAHLAEGQTQRAIAALKVAADLSRHDYPYKLYALGLAQALQQAGKLAEALETARQAARHDKSDQRIWLDLDRSRALLVAAEIQQALGNRAEASKLAQEFLHRWSHADPNRDELERARRLAARS